MKTKITAAVLAAVLLFHVGGEFTRAKATGVAVAGIATIGILAFNLLGVMTGKYDDIAEGISCIIENGVDGWQKAFVGTEDTPSWFASGWQQIYDTCSGWFDSGEITINDDGKVRMKYSQYLELCGLVGNASADISFGLGTDNDYVCFKASMDIPYFIDNSLSFFSGSKSTFMPIFYDEDSLLIPSAYFTYSYSDYSSVVNDTTSYSFWFGNYNPSSMSYSNLTSITGCRADVPYGEFLDYIKFLISSNTSTYSFYLGVGEPYATRSIYWTSFDGKSYTKLDNPDFTGKSFAYINFKDLPSTFFKSVIDYTTTTLPVDIDDLSDPLATVLTKTTDPTLEIDTDPAIASPDDAVMVTDIPGEGDLTLSQLKEKTRTDIDIPSLIADKFPFCIPFDFIRIISVLCADPVAPVFRIPISTNPESLEAFEGNQTIGDIPEDFKPMFDIDEEIVIDLSCIPLVQPICYTIFILGFVILLIYITPKMINH